MSRHIEDGPAPIGVRIVWVLGSWWIGVVVVSRNDLCAATNGMLRQNDSLRKMLFKDEPELALLTEAVELRLQVAPKCRVINPSEQRVDFIRHQSAVRPIDSDGPAQHSPHAAIIASRLRSGGRTNAAASAVATPTRSSVPSCRQCCRSTSLRRCRI